VDNVDLGPWALTAAAGFLCRSVERNVGCLNGLTDEEARWRPPASGANSLLALAWHAQANAEEKVRDLLLSRQIDSDHTCEFADEDLTIAAVRNRWQQLEPALRQGLEALPPAALGEPFQHPRRGQLSGFEVLIVALRHATEHMGQAELTRDLALARRS
jgi:hypothetical protein